jgi:putative transposase
MLDISATLHCLACCLDKKSLRRLGLIAQAMLAMTGRVTMLGISRWTEEGASYRTIQRFFNSKLLWCELQWCLLRSHLLVEDDVYLLAGDEVVVTKAGKHSFGLDRFFSSLYGRAVKGLCFFSFSLISTKRRTSYPLGCWQRVRSDKAVSKRERGKSQAKVKRPRGRPKGSKNRDQVNVELSEHLQFMQGLLQQVLKLIRSLRELSSPRRCLWL